MLLSQAPTADAVTLSALEEPVTNLVSPVAQTIPPMKYAYAGGALIATTVTALPLICANTSAPISAGMAVNPVYYSGNAFGATNPLPFVFGASAASPTVSAQAFGASSMNLKGGSMQIGGDALGSLVCYGLDENGARRLTPDVFKDGLDGAVYNSSIVLSVLHVPTSPTDYYAYTIDVTLPPLPAGTSCGPAGLDCNFALVEGFDSSVFATSAGNATSGLAGQWCMAPAGTQSCSFPPPSGGTQPVGGNVNVNYANFGAGGLPTLTAPVAPAAAKTFHFVAFRYLKNNVNSVPATGAPVVIATLFSPTDLEENKLDDNVAAGNNQIANAAASVVTNDATWSTFLSGISALTENTDSGALTFNIYDSDTAETGGTLNATVTLLVNDISVPVTPTCVLAGSQPAPPAVARQCTVDIPLNNANWWNASVASSYDGLFNALATDGTNGSYAAGVSASAQIVAKDALGKASPVVNVPVHVHSSVNNAPVIAYASPFAQQIDPNNNQSYPTYACSVGLGSAAGGCGAAVRGVIVVDLPGSVTAVAGPPAAFDELASQTTAVVPFHDASDSYTNVQCDREQTATLFAADGGPIVAASGGTGTLYDVNFVLSTTPPASAVSALCGLTITDVGSFPNGQSATTAIKHFRVVINP